MNKHIKHLAGAAALASMLFVSTACDSPEDDNNDMPIKPVPTVVSVSPSASVSVSPSVSVKPSVKTSLVPSVDPDDCAPTDEGCPDLPGDGN